MSDGWGNHFLWYHIPTLDMDDMVRDYFGEKVAWMFVWQSCYARMLLPPAILGSIFFFRRFFLSETLQQLVQVSFAFLMCFWVMFFNVSYDRWEKRVQARWGNINWEEDAPLRDEYRYSLRGS